MTVDTILDFLSVTIIIGTVVLFNFFLENCVVEEPAVIRCPTASLKDIMLFIY